jgi:hypothetical protein
MNSPADAEKPKPNGHDTEVEFCRSCGNVEREGAFTDVPVVVRFPVLVLPDGLEIQMPACLIAIRQCGKCKTNLAGRAQFIDQDVEEEHPGIVVPTVF